MHEAAAAFLRWALELADCERRCYLKRQREKAADEADEALLEIARKLFADCSRDQLLWMLIHSLDDGVPGRSRGRGRPKTGRDPFKEAAIAGAVILLVEFAGFNRTRNRAKNRSPLDEAHPSACSIVADVMGRAEATVEEISEEARDLAAYFFFADFILDGSFATEAELERRYAIPRSVLRSCRSRLSTIFEALYYTPVSNIIQIPPPPPLTAEELRQAQEFLDRRAETAPSGN